MCHVWESSIQTCVRSHVWDGEVLSGEIISRPPPPPPPPGRNGQSLNVHKLTTKTPLCQWGGGFSWDVTMVFFLAWHDRCSFKSHAPFLSFKIIFFLKKKTVYTFKKEWSDPCRCFLFCVWQRSRTAWLCGYAEGETPGIQEDASLAIANKHRQRGVPHGVHSHCV